jgi:hypothetical protein
MRLFFDLRLGYLVSAPGQDSGLSGLTGKAGDTTEVQIVFGRSSDPTGAASIISSPTWTPENLAGGTVITIGLKEEGDYGDGTLLAGTSTYSLDAGTNTYSFTLPLNTTEINTALLRLDADGANDLATLDCQFEVTFQIGGSGGWQSSILPVPFVIYNDVIGGAEGTPTNAADPDEYLLKAAGIEWLPTVTSQIGGTSADLDAIATVAVDVGKLVIFADADSANLVRVYQLIAGTDAESAPAIIRPDDYATTTNEKVWTQRQIDGDLLLPDVVSQVEAEVGTATTSRTWTAERVKQAIEALESPTVAEPPNGLASSVANEIVLFNGTDGKQLKRATGTGIAKVTSGVLSTATAATDFVAPGAATTSGLTMATSRLIGRTTASTGAFEEISVAGGLTLSSGVLTSAMSGTPSGVVSLTADTNLVVGSHNGMYIECTGAMTTVTISPQSSSTWTDGAYFWIANRLSSGSITIARGSGVSLLLTNVSANYTLASGDRPVKIWRSASDVWRIIT